jgi:hypothetical protein
LEKLGISAFTQIPEEKTIIRPLLVWYGDAKRKQSNGRYWVDIIDAAVEKSSADFCIITDVRYDFYDRDEISWVKDERRGMVVHISRYSSVRNRDPKFPYGIRRDFVQPANDHERENDPKVKVKANHAVEWEHIEGLSDTELLTNPKMVSWVDHFVDLFIDL